MSGPCLTDAAPETAPGGLFVRESRYAEARTSTQRSLRQLASVVPSPPLYRTCHDVRSSASWPTEISVSPTTKRVNRIDYASRRTLLHGACGVSPQDRRELGDVAAQGREGVKES